LEGKSKCLLLAGYIRRRSLLLKCDLRIVSEQRSYPYPSMKKVLLGSVAAMALATSANSADLPQKVFTKAPLTRPDSSWTGFYLFGGGGYGLWAADQQVDPGLLPMDPLRTGGRGYFGTIGGGYDLQFSSSWVAGIFADAQFGSMQGTYNASMMVGATASPKNTLNYAAGGRIGYLIAPNALSYVNAGYSYAEFSGSTLSSPNVPMSFPTAKFNLDGWFVGGGVEHSLDIFGLSLPGLFMKTEYRLAEYGHKNVIITDGPFAGPLGTFKPYVQTVSTSLVYRFNWNGAPSRVASTPLYAKAPAAAATNWTGFYLAGGGGYGLLTNDQNIPGTAGPFNARMGGRGYYGTVGGGYDWQFAPSWVGGVFADAQFGDIEASTDLVGTGRAATPKNNINSAAGVRAGYLVAPNVLSYVNVGYSRAEFTKADFSPALTSYTLPKTQYDGWFLGGGVENSFDIFGLTLPGLFMKTEYRFAEYDRKSATIVENNGGAPLSYSFKPYVQTISTSLVYRFN
jgi:outer membrane immunogenic protein